MRAVLFMYDIPTKVSTKDYPSPCSRLRSFAARIEYSCWVVPEGQIQKTEEIANDLRAVGATVDTLRFDETDEGRIKAMAKRSIESDAKRIREYVDASVSTTAKKLAEARKLQSADETNAAIRFQQTALQRARAELTDAESCAVAFDLTGDLRELTEAVRKSIEARAGTFAVEKKEAREEAKGFPPESPVTVVEPAKSVVES